MKVIIEATAEEIADLIKELRGQQRSDLLKEIKKACRETEAIVLAV